MKTTEKNIREIKNKKVILRTDYNVPIKNGRILDNTRIKASLKTIKLLLKNNNSIIIISHLGRPKTKEKKYSLKPIALELTKLLKKEILFSKNINEKTIKTAQKLQKKQILMLENIRYYEEETKNDKGFSKKLSQLGEVYINDAFSASHRNHASITGIPKYLPSYYGLLFEKELEELKKIIKPKKPFTAIIGGAKISTKMGLIKKLAEKANNVIIGGAMIFTLLKAKNIEVGKSLIERDKIKTAKTILKYKNIILPEDIVVAKTVSENAKIKNKKITEIGKEEIGLDIGEKTIKKIEKIIKKSKTILWNGPLGLAELEKFSKGTKKVARIIAEETKKHNKTSIIGGGDTINIINKMRINKKNFTYISMSGGAMLEYIEKETLPGIKAIEQSQKKYIKK